MTAAAMTTPRESGVRFEGVWLRELRLDAKESAKERPSGSQEIQVSVEVSVPEDEDRATVTMTVQLVPTDPKAFTLLTVAVEGRFVPTDDDSRQKLRAFVERQGAALMFPFVREIIATVTMRTPGGYVLLPPLNLYPTAQKADEAAK